MSRNEPEGVTGGEAADEAVILARRPWKLSRVDIRAPVSSKALPVARVELEHEDRGRITDLASAPGPMDAAFAAVAQMMRVPARVATLEMHYAAADPAEGPQHGLGAAVLVEMTIDVEGEVFAGKAGARDILPACVAAFVDAASHAEAVRSLRAAVKSRRAAAQAA
jgi:2-isopropylmalate synthase